MRRKLIYLHIKGALAWMRLPKSEQARRLSVYAPSVEKPTCAASC